MSWPSVKLGEVCRVTPGFAFKSADFTHQGIPVVKIANITDHYTVDIAEAEHWPDELFNEKLARFLLQDRDILLAMTGATAGKFGRVRTDQALLLNQRVAKIQPLEADPDFIWFLLSSSRYRELFYSLAGGAAQPNMSGGQIEAVGIPLPPRPVQERIGSTLSAYDDLIENNQRRMALLEEAARQLYREWFVRLRFPGHEHTRIINGVPEGWDSGTIGDFFDTTSGGTPSRVNPDFYTGDINWVKTQELNDDFIFETEERITEEALSRSSAKLFPSNTLLVSIYGGSNIGRTGILAEPAATNQACCALFPKDARAHYIYGALYLREQREHLIALAQGSAQTNISQQVVRTLPMLMPASKLMTAFVEALSAAFMQLRTLKRQNEKLRTARDLLLPRLINGKVTVRH